VKGVRPIVVFNPHPWRLQTGVEVEFGGLRHGDRLFDDTGKEVTFQPVRSLASVIAVFFLAQRYFVEGIATTGSKG